MTNGQQRDIKATSLVPDVPVNEMGALCTQCGITREESRRSLGVEQVHVAGMSPAIQAVPIAPVYRRGRV